MSSSRVIPAKANNNRCTKMEKHISHVIDTKAQKHFQNCIPDEWNVNEFTNDYGIDFNVETAEGGALTGISFLVQLKGQQKTKYTTKGTCVTYYLKKKHADYYVDKVKQPVFLILVDNFTKNAFWTFVQPAIQALRRDKKQAAAKTFPIRIPVSNELKDIPKLKAAVAVAHEHMAAMHPASIKNAIGSHKSRIESLDSRLSVHIDVVNNEERIWLQPKEPIQFTLKFMGEKAEMAAKLDDVFEKGLPATFGPGEIASDDLPVLKEDLSGGATLIVASHAPGHVELSAKIGKKTTLSNIRFDGMVSGGKSEARFASNANKSPLSLSLKFRLGKSDENRFAMNFTSLAYQGIPVQNFPYFDEIYDFFIKSKKAKFFQVKCYAEGNLAHNGTIQKAALTTVKSIYPILTKLFKIRQLCKLLKINPQFDIEAAFPLDLDRLRKLITKGVTEQKATGCILTCTIPKDNLHRFFEADSELGGEYMLSDHKCGNFNFMGCEADIGNVEVQFAFFHLKTTREDWLKMSASNEQTATITFVGGKRAVYTIRKVN